MKLNWIIPLFAAAGLALAGCGGGGSSSSTSLAPPSGGTPPMDDTDTTPTAASVTLPTERPTSYTAPTAGTISLAAGETEDSGSVTFTCPAGGEDCEIEVAADGTVTSTGGEATAMLTTAAMAALTLEQTMTAEEMKLRAVGVADALPGATTNGVSVSVARKTSAAATFKSAGYTAGAAPASAGADWAGATLTRRNIVQGTDSSNSITVYNDIEAPESVAFGKVYGTSPSHQTAARERYFAEVGTAAYDAATRTLTLPTGTALTTAQAGFLDSTHFPSVRGTTWQYNDAEEPADEHPYTFDAKFHGAEGTYTCVPTSANADCTAARAANGTLTLDGGAWTFQAKRSAKAVVTDVDHLTFGYWLQTPDTTDNTGDYVYSASLIATGSQAFLFTEVANLAAGSATYSGSATGLYAVKTVEDGQTTAASHGSFLADASLTALFNGASPSMLSGEVTNFRGGDTDMTGWSVGLNQTAIGQGTDDTTTTNVDESTFAVVSAPATGSNAEAYMGTTKSKAGTWSAGLYGAGGVTRAQPTGVSGTFNVSFDNANIAGAFGARKE